MTKVSTQYKTGKIRIDNQQKIIEAAEIEFAQSGFKGASIMSIAKRAGLPRPNIHYYFDNKLELYNKVLMDTLELWNQIFNQFSADDDPAEALSAYIRAKVMHSKMHPLASKIFTNELINGAPHLAEYLNKDFRKWLRSKSSIIQSWIEQGKMDPVDPFHLMFLIWSSTQYYADSSVQVTAALGKKKISAKDFDAIADSLVHIILKGCGIKPPKPINS